MAIQDDAQKLEEEVGVVLRLALARAASEKNSLVARQTPGRLWVTDFLTNANLSTAAQEFISVRRMTLGVPDGSAGRVYSVGAFMLAAGSLSGAIRLALEARDLAKQLFDDDLADYFASLNYCLYDVKLVIEKSRTISSSGRVARQEFCSLCWRLVNKFGLQNFSDCEGYSAHYCAAHHPKLQTRVYHRARRALVSAAKRRATDEDLARLSDYEANKRVGITSEEIFYRLTKSFMPDIPAESLRFLNQPADCWEERAKQLLAAIEIIAPEAYSQIGGATLSRYRSWADWFLSVVSALDGSGTDVQCWSDAGDFSGPEGSCFDGDIVGWRVVLHICRRYQAAEMMASSPRPRGPKRGEVAKNSEIRVRLKRLVLRRQKKGMPVVWSHIAKELGISRQRVSVLAKELGLL